MREQSAENTERLPLEKRVELYRECCQGDRRSQGTAEWMKDAPLLHHVYDEAERLVKQ